MKQKMIPEIQNLSQDVIEFPVIKTLCLRVGPASVRSSIGAPAVIEKTILNLSARLARPRPARCSSVGFSAVPK